MNDDELAAISALAANATPGGGWEARLEDDGSVYASPPTFDIVSVDLKQPVTRGGPIEDGGPVLGALERADAEFIAAARTAVPALVAALAEARAKHRDLTRRLGFGDNVTEPMADNDTIVAWFEGQSRDAAEWQESQQWRIECHLAGHDECEDCYEHDPSLRLITAESALAEAHAENEAKDKKFAWAWALVEAGEDRAEAIEAALAEAHRTLADREKAIEWTYRFAGGDGDRHGPNLASNVRDRLRRIVGEIRSGAESAGEPE